MAEMHVPSKSAGAGHELSDLNPKNIALFAIVLTLTIIAAFVVTYALFQRFLSVAAKTQAVPDRFPTPGSRLQNRISWSIPAKT